MDKKELLQHLRMQGFSDKIIGAFDSVNREEYIGEALARQAYEDTPLPIGDGQTISQPTTIAFMLELLELEDGHKILEVGSGSGYVISLIKTAYPRSNIIGIERIRSLAQSSQKRLEQFDNVQVINQNGFAGYPRQSPYDRILVSAAADSINKTLIDQLVDGGIAVMPVGDSIYKIIKKDAGYDIESYPGFLFVPLVDEKEN
jgi:protein-L-isoaspartate(D-aspartate) O-methyltransferase